LGGWGELGEPSCGRRSVAREAKGQRVGLFGLVAGCKAVLCDLGRIAQRAFFFFSPTREPGPLYLFWALILGGTNSM
jgi:hypothetical protein